MLRACLLLLYDVLLVSLAVEDYKYGKIRNGYVQFILLLSVAAWIVMPEIRVFSRVAGMLIISLPMLFFKMIFPGSFGGGDVKLVFASGAFLGWELVVKGTVAAVFLAGIYCICLICIKRKNAEFALGPFLSTGYILCTFYLF